ncbi:hypothetical protein L861_02680 [Litchfieldella anticariensis FP35 = DSM 16096]|uniref:asparagine synthase (glutamine-hydrolyzing) n=1 Tax=Litchfieldella anticariensis (strain DSM 16096 / CECT 5854 / CIP 108499 / LMG 22089 / FP35) TaxID=1121939 RepID=S2L8S2_LITA3|nr:asparagine synthetase B family protein [Halomonas anticariensis]EPC04239.1 hypothetical protein L861_02680 [Halomonas anticariensis FP35 = DSM 16096]
MSGLCGIIKFDGSPVDRAEVERMAARAAHRGPHGIHYYYQAGVGLACLSMDPTSDGTGACRPVVAGGERVVFVADARLDNRDECQQWGSQAAVISSGTSQDGALPIDAELMLGALLADGERRPGRLVGDYAYALWDAERLELRLSRDAMGMRSLYYRVELGRVLFATEVKQILAANNAPRRLNEQAVAWHLAGMQTPPGCVFYEGIEEVKPGEEVLINMLGHVRQRTVWHPDPDKRIRYRDEREYAEHFRELIVDAMRCRLRARGRVGVSLSGGMDSGTIATVAGWLVERGESTSKVCAYSWAFNEFFGCDERENSYRMADRYGIPIHEIPAEETRPLVNDAAHEPDEDDPFMMMYQAFVSRGLSTAAADRITVMFYGDRGDMICGNFLSDIPGMLSAGLISQAYRELLLLSRIHGQSRISSVSRYILRPTIASVVPPRVISKYRRKVLWLRLLAARKDDIHAHQLRAGPGGRVGMHVRNSFLDRAKLPLQDPIYAAAAVWKQAAVRQRYICIFAPFLTRGLIYNERECAKYGIEYSDPWSDRRIAEFILACPQHYVNRATEPKRIARRAMQGIMPDDAIRSARKTSPSPLYEEALRNQAYAKVMQLITNSCCKERGYIDEVMLQKKFSDFVHGKTPYFDIWSIISLEKWLKKYWCQL